jgi:hypothetical protein
MINYYLAFLTWGVYCTIEGIMHEFIWHKARLANDFDNNWRGKDIHVYFTYMRLLVVGLLLHQANMWSIVLVAALVQPFIHNGFMYSARNTELGFSAFIGNGSSDSSAKLSFKNGRVRLGLFLLGIIVIFVQSAWYYGS